jgi:hypothetical protein
MALITVQLERTWFGEVARQFTIQSDVDWLSPDSYGAFESDSATATFEITTFENTEAAVRSGEILIQSNPEGAWEARLPVGQEAHDMVVTVVPSSLTLNADGTAQ